MKPFFSIIIPAFNSGKTISHTLESIEKQTFRDFEVIVVDDGSTDNTRQKVEKFGFVNYLWRINAGPGAARNFGARISKGRYLVFVDADDILLPWALSLYFQIISKVGEVSLFGGQVIAFSNQEHLKDLNEENRDIRVYSNYFEASKNGIFVGAGMLGIESGVFSQTGGFNEKEFVAEDIDLTYRIGNLPGFFFVNRPYIIGYREVADSLSRNPLRVYKGLRFVYAQVSEKKYPDDSYSRNSLAFILAQHSRSNSLALKKQGYYKEAFWLYKRNMLTNLRYLKFKYIIGFWFY
ncbi:glycosyltransferase family 2 protein [Flavihumibacter stibioxidans]|uniref:Glycosyltransferase 2-like domain-containing protein n=1 Tax=Flavihumibacter stibioxidans TaxID=1834163 RepID=A0ABR7M7N0_9BACT|nr:glycosyltransferase family 2 protein [Flavihumibacter stibioxidans]MBC6491025.1 hypothetical protein [Flavihumibacter stibioxidans]